MNPPRTAGEAPVEHGQEAARPRYLPIEDYAPIGDLATMALVGECGSIDFFCAPEFDSPSLLAALLDRDRGGCFSVQPRFDVYRHRQMYLPDTNVLVTRFLAADGIVELVDFMPVRGLGYPQGIVRMMRAIRGPVPIAISLRPAFDYARADHQVERRGEHLLFCSRGPDRLAFRLHGSIRLEPDGRGGARGELRLEPGQEEWLSLERVEEGEQRSLATDERIRGALEATTDYWRRWASRFRYQGRWREQVLRCALALKLLTSERHGSMIAAPTFGLPEVIGGVRNWDYRYVWPRDTSFALRALGSIGFEDESDRFIEWLERVCRARVGAGRPLDVMYRIDGRTDIDEVELDHLEGYRGSRPVRIGNGAHAQIQLDVYGELLDALLQHDLRGWPVHHDLWLEVVRIVDWVCDNWRTPDAGIWEIRGEYRPFLHSRAMCWVALDRAVRLARAKSRPAPLDRWIRERDAIYHDIYAQYWSDELGAFTQYPGARAVDASSLLLTLYGFISPTDERWLSSLAEIERELVEGAFVHRYRLEAAADNGLPGREGTFSACSFWLVECLARAGKIERARLLFELMLGYANHVGLYAEELGPSGEHLGNFPQGLALLALINAAVDLDQRLSAAAYQRRRKGPGG